MIFGQRRPAYRFFVHVRKLKGNNILARMIGGYIWNPWFLVLIGKYRLAVDWNHGRHCLMRATNNGVRCHFLSTFDLLTLLDLVVGWQRRGAAGLLS